MTEIPIHQSEPDTIYCYYQVADTRKYLAFVRLVDACGRTFTYVDICDYYVTGHYDVNRIEPEGEFTITVPVYNKLRDAIHLFEMTEDEIRDHVLMENI